MSEDPNDLREQLAIAQRAERELQLIDERLRAHIGMPRSRNIMTIHLLSETLGTAEFERRAEKPEGPTPRVELTSDRGWVFGSRPLREEDERVLVLLHVPGRTPTSIFTGGARDLQRAVDIRDAMQAALDWKST